MRLLLLTLSLLVLVGCATPARNLTGLEPGMARTDVHRLLGRPDSTSADGPNETYLYRLSSGFQLKDDIKEPTHYVRLHNGRVQSFGPLVPGARPATRPTIDVNVRQH